MTKLSLPLSLFMLATAPIIVKFSRIHPLALLCWRLTFVCLLLLPFIIVKKSALPSRNELKKIALVACFLVAHFYTWFKGVPQLPIAVATIIYATNPIYTGILSFLLLREPYHPRYLLGLLLCFGGIYATLHQDLLTPNFNLEGVLTMFATAIFYSCYMTLAKKMRLNMPNTPFNFYLNLLAAAIAFGLIFFNNNLAGTTINWLDLPLSQWGVALTLALFPSLMGHTLMIHAIKEYNLNFVSIFKLLNPMIAALLAYWIFGEVMRSGHWLGMGLVVTGVVLSLNWFDKAPTKVE